MLLDVSPEPARGSLILLAFAVVGFVAAGIFAFVALLKLKRRSSDHRDGATQPSNPNQP
jgi:flagellar biosynthesis/type III secretory pathway M-ring protein FliF/YscJ